MNDVATQELPATQNLDRSMTAGELTRQALLVQEILEKVMVDGVHYGIIPGTEKPTLYQPGAEKICATFHLAPKQVVEDLSEPHNNFFRYRVACSLYTINNGLFVGAAVGEASSAEEKFQWQAAICDEQWEATDPTRRRVKYFKDKNSAEGFGTVKQVQRNAADLANTVLKIAAKRAFISATRGATAASDLLDVDLEDEAVADVARENLEEQKQPAVKPKAKAKPAPSFAYGKFKDKQITDPDIPVDYLEYMSNQIAAGIQEINADPKHKRAKFKAQDQLFLAAIDAEVAQRKAVVAKPAQNPAGAAPGSIEPPKAEEATRKPFSDNAWADMVIYFEEETGDAYSVVKKEFTVTSAHDLPADKRTAFYDRVMALRAEK